MSDMAFVLVSVLLVMGTLALIALKVVSAVWVIVVMLGLIGALVLSERL